jgi:hypothetical protein
MQASLCQAEREVQSMLTALQITSRLHVTPLLDVHYPTFEKLYRDGIWWSLFKGDNDGSVTDHYVIENLRALLAEAYVDEQHGYWLPLIGFHIGRLHGAILSPQTGQLQPGVTALVRFQNEDAARGYRVGREWYFIDAQPDERTCTDVKLMERFQELQRESVTFRDGEATWYYAIGCILGELSGQLFSATSQEYTQWEAERKKWLAEYEQTTHQETDTEPLDPVPIVEHAV